MTPRDPDPAAVLAHFARAVASLPDTKPKKERMMKTPLIKIDLKKIDPAQLEEAREHGGHCRYSAPCIVGAMMTQDERRALANLTSRDHLSICVTGDSTGIRALARSGIVAFPDSDQIDTAILMQRAFDRGDFDTALDIFNEYRARPEPIDGDAEGGAA